METRGRLIAVEGIEGAGKATLVHALADHLEAEGQPVERLTRYLMPELVGLWKRLVAADAVDPRQAAALAAADLVVGGARPHRPPREAGRGGGMDGYIDAHRVYFQLLGVPAQELDALFSHLIEPDAILYLRVPLDLALKRVLPRSPANLAWSGGPALLDAANPEAAFLAWQARAQALYSAILPPSRTTTLRGDQPPDAILQAALDTLPPR